MGVCCIVFDIDGMLFDFFMNFLNIEKNIYIFIFSIFQVFFSRFMLFSTLKKNLLYKKKNSGGGGGWIFLEKQFFLISRYILFKKKISNKILKSAPSLWDPAYIPVGYGKIPLFELGSQWDMISQWDPSAELVGYEELSQFYGFMYSADGRGRTRTDADI